MRSFFDENDVKFDVGSSPLPFSDNVRQQEFDFSLGLHSPSPGRFNTLSTLEQDLFADFPPFDPNLFMGESIKGNDPSANLQDRQLHQPFLSQPIKASILPLSKDPPDQASSEYDQTDINHKPNTILSSSQPSEISPKGRKKRNSPAKSKSASKQDEPPQFQEIPSCSQEVIVVNSTSPDCSDKILRKKKQKLRKNLEIFQPFMSFSNLETTVKSLREIMNSPSSIHNRLLNREVFFPKPDNLIDVSATI